MSPLFINPTAKTPRIVFDSNMEILSIQGRLVPEDPIEIFDKLITIFDNPGLRFYIKIYIELEYINSTSLKLLVALLRKATPERVKNITWAYKFDDEDMKETGLDIKSSLKSDPPFILKKIQKYGFSNEH